MKNSLKKVIDVYYLYYCISIFNNLYIVLYKYIIWRSRGTIVIVELFGTIDHGLNIDNV